MPTLLSALLFLLPSTLALPTNPNPTPRQITSTIDGPYTLTAYAPSNATLNGAKSQNGGLLFAPTVASYCPTIVGSACPNGTETVYYGTLSPSSLVPGGQDLYVLPTGAIRITVQHSHSIPPNAYWSYQGWSYNPLDPASYTPSAPCPADDPRYDCTPPAGYWTFQAPGAAADVGGVVACPGEDGAGVEAWAVTPGFERTDCERLVGLGARAYVGVTPPVWSYM